MVPASFKVFGVTGNPEGFLITTLLAPWISACTYTSVGFI